MRRARRIDGITEDYEAPRPITCARPECSRQAAARLVIDVGRRVVTMDLLVDEVGGAASLCSIHADKVIPPRDWTLEDRREMVPRLFKVSHPDGASSDEPVVESVDDEVDRPRKRRRKRAAENDEVESASTEELESSDEQLVFENVPYDFPPGYAKQRRERDVDPEPDSTGSPLLARAFDAGRSRKTPSHLDPNHSPTE